MKVFRVPAWALAFALMATAALPASAQYEELPPEGSNHILPDVGNQSGSQYVPPWADPYATPGDVGVNVDPTPFNPADVDANANFD